MQFLLYTGVLVLAFICLFTVLVILMQRPSANAGMGAALGGGAAEQAFGGEAGNVLTKLTTGMIIAFFVLSFGLFLGFKHTKPIDNAGVPKDDGLIKQLQKDAPATVPAVAPVTAPKEPATVPAVNTTPATPAAPAAATTPAATPATTPAPAATTTPAPAPAAK